MRTMRTMHTIFRKLSYTPLARELLFGKPCASCASCAPGRDGLQNRPRNRVLPGGHHPAALAGMGRRGAGEGLPGHGLHLGAETPVATACARPRIGNGFSPGGGGGRRRDQRRLRTPRNHRGNCWRVSPSPVATVRSSAVPVGPVPGPDGAISSTIPGEPVGDRTFFSHLARPGPPAGQLAAPSLTNVPGELTLSRNRNHGSGSSPPMGTAHHRELVA